jgi:hypothetical protein
MCFILSLLLAAALALLLGFGSNVGRTSSQCHYHRCYYHYHYRRWRAQFHLRHRCFSKRHFDFASAQPPSFFTEVFRVIRRHNSGLFPILT